MYGVAEPGKVLHCRTETRLPAEHAMVVRVLSAKGDLPGQLLHVNTQSAEPSGISVYEYTENSRAHFLVFRNRGATVWRFADWESDAEFFYYCADGQRISQMAACNVSVIKYHGEALIPASRRVERFEYWELDGKRQAASSDKEILRSFSDSTLASWDAGVVR